MKNSSLILLFLWIFSASLFSQTPQWAVSVHKGYNESDFDNKVVTDQAGDIYVAGTYKQTMQFSNSDIELNGAFGMKIYLYKISSDGDLLWAHKFIGASIARVFDMAIDQNNNVYVVGEFRGSIAVGSGGNSISLSGTGMRDAFIIKYSPTGQLMGAHNLGGAGKDNITTINIDSDNNILLAGNFVGEVDFDLSSADDIRECSGLTIVKYNQNFELITVVPFSSGISVATSIESTPVGGFILSGYFRDHVLLDAEEGITGCPQYSNCGFLMKIGNSETLDWATSIIGTSSLHITGMQIAQPGDIYITGDFSNTAHFTSYGTTQTFESSDGSRDIFLGKVKPTGEFAWINTMGGTGDDVVAGLELDNGGNLILAGTYAATMDFDPGSGSAEYTSEGSASSYISVYKPNGDYASTYTLNSPDENIVTGIAVTGGNEIYLTGWFKSSINFDPSQSGFDFTTISTDNYILKLGAITVGIAEKQAAYPINIYPNPARDEVHIAAPDIREINVYTIHGKLVLSQSANVFSDKHTIQTSHLPAGTYMLSLTANDGFIRLAKLVIAK